MDNIYFCRQNICKKGLTPLFVDIIYVKKDYSSFCIQNICKKGFPPLFCRQNICKKGLHLFPSNGFFSPFKWYVMIRLTVFSLSRSPTWRGEFSRRRSWPGSTKTRPEMSDSSRTLRWTVKSIVLWLYNWSQWGCSTCNLPKLSSLQQRQD
jgi:hypothetical protein